MARRTTPIVDPAPGGDGVYDDGQMAKAIQLAEKGIETNEHRKAARERKPDVVAPPEGQRDETLVEVVCIVTNDPWTHERPLKHGERTKVPRWVADIMVANGQVVVI